jgi:hypothetical protein
MAPLVPFSPGAARRSRSSGGSGIRRRSDARAAAETLIDRVAGEVEALSAATAEAVRTASSVPLGASERDRGPRGTRADGMDSRACSGAGTATTPGTIPTSPGGPRVPYGRLSEALEAHAAAIRGPLRRRPCDGTRHRRPDRRGGTPRASGSRDDPLLRPTSSSRSPRPSSPGWRRRSSRRPARWGTATTGGPPRRR